MRGVEPPRLAAQGPKPCVSAIPPHPRELASAYATQFQETVETCASEGSISDYQEPLNYLRSSALFTAAW